MKKVKKFILGFSSVSLVIGLSFMVCSFSGIFDEKEEPVKDNNKVLFGFTNSIDNDDINVSGNATISFNETSSGSSSGSSGSNGSGGINFSWNNLVPEYKNNSSNKTGTYSIQIADELSEYISFKDKSSIFDGTWTNKETPTEVPDFVYNDDANKTTIESIIDTIDSPTLIIKFDANPDSNGYIYAYDATSTSYIITKFSGSGTILTIPSTFNDGTNGSHDVTEIGESAFAYNRTLTSVTIPTTLLKIKRKAFIGCTKLATLTFTATSTLTTIGQQAFENCTALTSVTIPNSVTSILSEAFAYCSGITSFTFPTNTAFTWIWPGVLRNCTAIASITLPTTITSLLDKAFFECSSLKLLTIFPGITRFDDSALKGNANNNLTNKNFKITCNDSTAKTAYKAGIFATYKNYFN